MTTEQAIDNITANIYLTGMSAEQAAVIFRSFSAAHLIMVDEIAAHLGVPRHLLQLVEADEPITVEATRPSTPSARSAPSP